MSVDADHDSVTPVHVRLEVRGSDGAVGGVVSASLPCSTMTREVLASTVAVDAAGAGSAVPRPKNSTTQTARRRKRVKALFLAAKGSRMGFLSRGMRCEIACYR
ncbi:hypothetical protein GCM10010185_42770 [Saccharothrix coeruleofusca]|uniref:Uncharacterized protein n=1 Tax=Saccharothrix coeruleofusca TaxID=33919 RepID=A0A918APN4_9PSEU|nr:hypothetical protein GCM10010185_42770 [Saccharothrix coeruleofusca]